MSKRKIISTITTAVILLVLLPALPASAFTWNEDNSGAFITGKNLGKGNQVYATVYDGVDYSAVYDFNYYYNKYPDLRVMYGRDDVALLNHFVTIGMDEGRQACESFDVQSYYNANQDLRMEFGFDLRQYYLHYMENGKKEKRKCTGVAKLQNPVSAFNGVELKEIYDGAYFMANNQDICGNFTKKTDYVTLFNDYGLFWYFVNYGIKEGRKGNNSEFWVNRKSINQVAVGNIIQYPELPSGCESVALTIALNYYGFNLGKTDIADYYMPYGETYIDTFLGDPYAEGSGGAMPPAVTIAANNFLSTQKTELKAYDITGADLCFLYTLIDLGYPVVVWSSIGGGEPVLYDVGETIDGINYYPWYDLEHCVVLFGYDKTANTVFISDPDSGYVTMDATWFEYIYDTIGRYAVVIK